MNSSENTLPDTKPDIGADTTPDLGASQEDDQQSDPARRAGEAGGWTDEGGATPDGPAAADD